MKKNYEKPSIEIIAMDDRDHITMSSGPGEVDIPFWTGLGE